MDSLRTTNLVGETTRMLAGKYDDPVFGQTEAQAVMQFRPTSPSTVLTTSSVFDSIIFRMRYDFYTYGAPDKTTQTFDIYEVTEVISPSTTYFFNSNIGVSPAPIGSTSMDVSYDFFKQEFEDTDKDSVIVLSVKLDNAFGQRLFDVVNPEDVNYTDPDVFKTVFKGLSIVPQQSDKVVGFNPIDLNSVLELHYHDGNGAKVLYFDFQSCISFSQIISDRSSTELSGLNQYHTPFEPATSRYVQGGSSIVTKIDLSKFYDYIDTLSNVIVNSAEIDISGVDVSSAFPEPVSLAISMLEPNNRFKTLKDKQDTTDYLSFGGLITLGDQGKFFIGDGAGKIFPVDYSSTTTNYSCLPTLFIQKLFHLKSTRYPYWAIRPLSPQPGKSLNRVVFPKDNIKLKIYYTRATLENQ